MKNVHLAPSWLVSVEKKLHTLTPHPGFRLFMTMEITPKVPVNLLRASRVFVYEPPPGIKANLLRTYNTIPAARMCQVCIHNVNKFDISLVTSNQICQYNIRTMPVVCRVLSRKAVSIQSFPVPS